jgi:hypothetical protein
VATLCVTLALQHTSPWGALRSTFQVILPVTKYGQSRNYFTAIQKLFWGKTRRACTYLTSGRDLLRLRVERESKSDPLVIADPMFGERDQLAKASVPQRKPPTRMRLRQNVTTGSDLSSSNIL